MISDAESGASGSDRRKILAMLAASPLALSAASCGTVDSETYRYRLTVEVDTPQGLRSGSGVIEVTARFVMAMPQSGMKHDVRGEAVAVDMPDGRTLFALVDEGGRMVPLAFQDVVPRKKRTRDEESWWELDLDQLRRIREYPGAVEVPINENPDSSWPSIHPRLVTFGDANDPLSAKEVKSLALDEEFGEGVSIRRFTVQATDEPVTTGIEKRLKWLPALRGTYLTGTQISVGSPFGLMGQDFSRGINP